MRRVSVGFVVMLCLVALGAWAQEGAVSFSGTWILNAEKSDQPGGGGRGGRGMMQPSKLVITQDAEKLVVETTRQGRGGSPVSETATYTLDGQECENGPEGRTAVSVVEWAEGHQSLTLFTERNFSRNGQTFTMESQAVWKLEEGRLVITTTMTTPRGDMTTKTVYDKQS